MNKTAEALIALDPEARRPADLECTCNRDCGDPECGHWCKACNDGSGKPPMK